MMKLQKSEGHKRDCFFFLLSSYFTQIVFLQTNSFPSSGLLCLRLRLRLCLWLSVTAFVHEFLVLGSNSGVFITKKKVSCYSQRIRQRPPNIIRDRRPKERLDTLISSRVRHWLKLHNSFQYFLVLSGIFHPSPCILCLTLTSCLLFMGYIQISHITYYCPFPKHCFFFFLP